LRKASEYVYISRCQLNFAAGAVLSTPSNSLEYLLETGGRHLYALLVRLTLREDVADDLLQELVVRLSRSEGFQKADKPFTYARRAAIHLAFDWHRQRKRQGAVESLLEEPIGEDPSPIAKLIARENHERILTNLEQLSELGRTCLALHYIEQLSYGEIAEQLNATAHQIRGVCHKGIRRLQQLMGVSSNRTTRKEEIADER
jgi:RNA polymerase sigma-70 factor (ECF subfamily)